MCTEAVLSVLNQGLNGGLPPKMAIRLGSGLPEGIGGSGCTCGALTGGVLALGLFLGRDAPGLLNGRSVRVASKELHDQFKECFGATCCRVLTKHLKKGSKTHFNVCADRTGWAAGRAGHLILKSKPDLIFQADVSYLEKKDSVVNAKWKQLTAAIQR